MLQRNKKVIFIGRKKKTVMRDTFERLSDDAIFDCRAPLEIWAGIIV